MSLKYTLIGTSAVAALAAFFLLPTIRSAPDTAAGPSAPSVDDTMVAVTVPTLNGNALTGQRIYENTCAACHGINASGTNGVAPPLVHKIYEPSHHADEAFQRAVATGVRSHHWDFGDMPPVEGLTRGDVSMVIAYIRELQRANGIN